MNNLLSVDGARLWHTIEYSSRFGATAKGGVRRLTLTDEDRRVRDWFQEQCKDAGCEVYIDEIGSMFAVRPGLDRSKPCIGIGSHLDTQPAGGRLDGILGVCAALEVVRTLNDANIETDASICIVNWTNEEGSRFSPAMMGSAVHIGSLALSEALAATDKEGISVANALDTIGYHGQNIADLVKLGSFVELHIEQGPRLEVEGAAIGVVESAYGVGTVGEVTIENASRNVIPGDVSFTIDCRFATEATGIELEQGIRRHCQTPQC